MESATTQSNYNGVLEELRACVAATLVDEGIDIVDAQRCSIAVIERMRSRQAWGGQKIYIPCGKMRDVDNMRHEIARRWSGRNTRELCREFDISESRLRQLAKRPK